ncbi:carotenoid 1,2-hydratase [Sphingomonas sp. LY54]|uniref:lipocalin-like domain-containing protein n=1 Tax=Sphingomonas sp. LY54 TaxID=3095343 RepID=UPI002D7690AA|nr:carotenoid 1,2-hydratase [Sphingomonas sp. LY54]WRP29593.1 carotenoid 1,2-hydratase [Sphingomonas sp. LY54]
MRRLVPLALLGLAVAAPADEALVTYPEVKPGLEFRFPRDHGAHPDYRTEWWYFTGWLQADAGERLGFQITFFRSRPAVDPANPSAFAPRQILFAHAALSDPATGRLLHDQRAARGGFGIAEARSDDADVTLLDWRLRRDPGGQFRAAASSREFALDLAFVPTQSVMANGRGGYSQKGPRPEQASYYYSLPQLKVTGTATRGGKRLAVTGTGWLDREWSSTLLAPGAAGWDWAGINLDDGGALMAFRVRGAKGDTFYAGGTLRRPDGGVVLLGPDDVRFAPRRRWRSPATGAIYPVETDLMLRLPEGVRTYRLTPLFDAQELDGRSAGMPVYWEGAVTTPGGRGYLELTGYAAPLSM